jgi:hypothetical protein
MRKHMIATLVATMFACNADPEQGGIRIDSRHPVRDAGEANLIIAVMSEGVVHPMLSTIGGPGAPGSSSTPVVVQNRAGTGSAIVTGRPQMVSIDYLDSYATQIDASLVIEFRSWRTQFGGTDITLDGTMAYQRHSLETHYLDGRVTSQIDVAMSGNALTVDCAPMLDRFAFNARNVSNEAEWFTGSLVNDAGDVIEF